MIEGYVLDWLALVARWFHLTAGIAWIGASFYFVWLDDHLERRVDVAQRARGVDGELWAVHGGGFYHNEKFLTGPAGEPLSERLHWFYWEAYSTWFSGLAMLALVYWANASTFMIDPAVRALTPAAAIGISAASLVAGWLVYDGLCRSALGKSLRLFGVVWFLLLTAAAYGLTRIFSDLGAFMHVGAIIGTVMVANVFLIIIPNQKKLVAQVLAGETPDASLGKRSKQRSVHNNYMTLPVLFIMISNHYPMIYAARFNWLWLAGLGLVGWTIRHFFNLRNAGRVRYEVLAYGALGFAAVAALNQVVRPQTAVASTGPVPTYAQVRTIVDRNCVMCHAPHPTHAGFSAPPAGAAFDTAENLHRHAAKIYERAVATHAMPLGDETHMTDAERAALGAWIKAGAPVGKTAGGG